MLKFIVNCLARFIQEMTGKQLLTFIVEEQKCSLLWPSLSFQFNHNTYYTHTHTHTQTQANCPSYRSVSCLRPFSDQKTFLSALKLDDLHFQSQFLYSEAEILFLFLLIAIYTALPSLHQQNKLLIQKQYNFTLMLIHSRCSYTNFRRHSHIHTCVDVSRSEILYQPSFTIASVFWMLNDFIILKDK